MLERVADRPAPGWYLDPADARWLRWWDGVRWTDAVVPGPVRGRRRVRSRAAAGVVAVAVGSGVAAGSFLLVAVGAAGAAETSPASDIAVITVLGAVGATVVGAAIGVLAFVRLAPEHGERRR